MYRLFMHSTGLTVQAFGVAAPLHKMPLFRSANKRQLMGLAMGGGTAGEEDSGGFVLGLLFQG